MQILKAIAFQCELMLASTDIIDGLFRTGFQLDVGNMLEVGKSWYNLNWFVGLVDWKVGQVV